MTDNPSYRLALQFIHDNDLLTLSTGKHVIDGDNLWVNIVDATLRPATEAKLEAHDKYIDIQIPLSAPEQFGVRARKDCTHPTGPYDEANDIIFFDDPIDDIKTVAPGQMIVFPPETAHAPLIGSGKIHKAIFKVRMEE
jgi:YhcH/YjgK/YiaL family protein